MIFRIHADDVEQIQSQCVVEYDANDTAVKTRREMEAAFGRRNVNG